MTMFGTLYVEESLSNVMDAQVIDLSREQERSKQSEARSKEAESQAAAQQYAIVSPLLALHECRA